jgi:hypothetical protein
MRKYAAFAFGAAFSADGHGIAGAQARATDTDFQREHGRRKKS